MRPGQYGYRLGINVGVNGVTPEEHLFDTGSDSFNIAVGESNNGKAPGACAKVRLIEGPTRLSAVANRPTIPQPCRTVGLHDAGRHDLHSIM